MEGGIRVKDMNKKIDGVVDISSKEIVKRSATATGIVRLSKQ